MYLYKLLPSNKLSLRIVYIPAHYSDMGFAVFGNLKLPDTLPNTNLRKSQKPQMTANDPIDKTIWPGY